MHIIDKSYWVVFNPTILDFTNSNETSGSAQKGLGGIRYWLTKKEGSEGYNYTGKGNYTGGPIIDIKAIEMQPSELSILSLSPRFYSPIFDQIKVNDDFLISEIRFRDCFLNCLSFALLQEDATPANIATAYTALSTVMGCISNLDFDNTYTNLNGVLPAGSFTATIKSNMIGLLEDYLENYPR